MHEWHIVAFTFSALGLMVGLMLGYVIGKA
jgi:uncharacterized membrane-anchored protein YhcB (DUF1043 family)